MSGSAFTVDSKDEAYRNSLTMIAGGTEMLRVSPDGFYVRGRRIPQDDQEANAVYEAFRQWLVWHQMTRT